MIEHVTNEAIALYIARSAIEAVLVRYARGVDRIDIPLIKSAFWPGAIDEHGTFNGSADAFADYLDQSLRKFESSSHCLSNVHVEVIGNTARVESRVTAVHVLKAEHGGHRFTLGARYLDRFERRGAEWRIAHRILVRDWIDVPLEAPMIRAMLEQITRQGAPTPGDPWDQEPALAIR